MVVGPGFCTACNRKASGFVKQRPFHHFQSVKAIQMKTSSTPASRVVTTQPLPVSPVMSTSRRQFFLFTAGCLPALWPLGHSHAAVFDHSHASWTSLLKRHVVLLRDGQASQVRYAGFSKDRGDLTAYLSSLSAVTIDGFSAFSLAQRQAFLINAYNAFTVELILTMNRT